MAVSAEAAPVLTAVSPPLDERSKYLRRLVVRALAGGERGHVGSSMSLIEIMRVLYDDILRVRPTEPKWPERDRMILSKGHGCLALYVMLADKGFIPVETLDTFCRRELNSRGASGERQNSGSRGFDRRTWPRLVFWRWYGACRANAKARQPCHRCDG